MVLMDTTVKIGPTLGVSGNDYVNNFKLRDHNWITVV
jgi:hypothetical protein